MTDIVERLEAVRRMSAAPTALCAEAATTIRDLRAEVERLREAEQAAYEQGLRAAAAYVERMGEYSSVSMAAAIRNLDMEESRAALRGGEG